MPRANPNRVRRLHKHAHAAPRKSGGRASQTPAQLLARGRSLDERGETAQALAIFEALADPAQDGGESPSKLVRCAAHEELAQLHVQGGRADDAERELRAAIALQPDEGFEKYAALAQLLGATRDALDVARRGVNVLRGEAAALRARISSRSGSNKNKSNNEVGGHDVARESELREMETSAQCAVAEIALALGEDCDDEEEAAEFDGVAEGAVTAALAVSDALASQLEGGLALANLRLSQGRREEARAAMARVAEGLADGLAVLDGGDASEEAVVEVLEGMPALEVRIAIAKQLVEVEMWDVAVSVLCSVMWECDFNVEVWYLLAVVYWKKGETEEAKQALETTRKVLHAPGGYEGVLEEVMIDQLHSTLREGRQPGGSDNVGEDAMRD